MVQTAKRLAQQQLDKTIILTGAMIPYAFVSSSDGFFNLGSALAFAQSLKANVYIAMQGRYFLWNEVEKTEKKVFLKRYKWGVKCPAILVYNVYFRG